MLIVIQHGKSHVNWLLLKSGRMENLLCVNVIYRQQRSPIRLCT